MVFRRHFLAAACSVSVSLLGAVDVSLAEQPAFDVNGAPAPVVEAPAGRLLRLPVGPDRLTLTGEYDRLEMPLYLSAAQTSGSARLVLSLQSAISVMPEASELSVFVNNVKVGAARLGSASKTPIEAELQPGLLQPGFNSISVVANQVHRVDCTRAGTYELWTWIDPLESGLVLGEIGNASYELAALGSGLRGADGQLKIRGHLPAGARLSLVADTLQVFQSAIVAAQISDFGVQMSAPEAVEPGLDLFVGTTRELESIVPRGRVALDTDLPGVQILPPVEGQAALIVSGRTDEELRDNVQSLAKAAEAMSPSGTATGTATVENAVGRELDGNQTISLSDLGYAPIQFRGRYYQDHIAFRLPADFYAADYDKASITLDAAYAPGLLPTSNLVIKANGHTVSTLSLSAMEGGMIKRQRLPISLGNLRAGENVISIEADLPSRADLSCDTATLANGGPRLTISPDSTLTLPRIARVGHSPNIAATMAGLSHLKGNSGDIVNLFVPSLKAQPLDAAAMLLGRMAYSSGQVTTTRVSSVAPNENAGDMIAVGSYSSIPSDLLAYVGIEHGGNMINMGSISRQPAGDAGGWLSAHAATSVDLVNLTQEEAASSKLGGMLDAFTQPVDLRARVLELTNSFQAYVVNLYGRITGTASGSSVADIPRFSPDENTSLVLAQRTAPLQSNTTWTVIASADDAALADSMRRIAIPANWVQMQGAISTLAKDSQEVTTIAAANEQLFETQPRSITNARLVLAGWFSHNMGKYVIGLFSTFILLGIATHLLARRVGRRN